MGGAEALWHIDESTLSSMSLSMSISSSDEPSLRERQAHALPHLRDAAGTSIALPANLNTSDSYWRIIAPPVCGLRRLVAAARLAYAMKPLSPHACVTRNSA